NSSVETNIWDAILLSLKTRLSQQAIDTWFQPIQFVRVDNSNRQIVLTAPNRVVRDWVTSNYSNLLDHSLKGLRLEGYSFNWSVGVKDTGRDKSHAVISRPPQQSAAFAAAAPAMKLEVAKPAPVLSDVAANAPPEPALSSKYTYESFVVGACNQFAHAASMAVAEAPGRTYNPLYLYGGVGLGKTHLMHACGHTIKTRNSHLRVCYISSEKFMNDLINAIRYDKTQSFREKYRSVDVLLIDDVQFMAGKERTQEEFFHTFNALYDQQKQIVISSDCPPREIPTLEERLHSRFEWGLIADIEPPDLETKIAILKRKGDL